MGGVIDLAAEPDFRLGDSEVHPAARKLAGPNGVELLEPRTAQVLVALARAAGAVVGRQMLVDSCWDGRIVGDDAINRAILKLRRAVDLAGAGFRVETVARVGYRLVVDPPVVANAPTVEVAPPGLGRRRLIAGGGLIALGVSAAALWPLGAETPARARELYDRGKVAFDQGGRADNAQAVAFFAEAAQIAPRDAAILGALALALRFEQAFLPPALLPATTARADRAVARALAIDPSDTDARAARALYLPFRNHWRATEQRLDAGLRDLPNSGVLNGFHGQLMAAVGRNRAALASLSRAVAHETYVPILRTWIVRTLFAGGQIGEADQAADAALGLYPRYADLWWLRFWLYALTGRLDAAAAHGARSALVPPEVSAPELTAARLAVAALRDRAARDIDAALAAWRTLAVGQHGLQPDAIGLAANLGRIDTAFEWVAERLQPYIVPGDQGMPATPWLFGAPAAPLRTDPRFAEWCERIGLGRYWQASGTRPDYAAGVGG